MDRPVARQLIIWLDAQLPPAAADWLRDLGESEAHHVRDLGLMRADDTLIFQKARDVNAVVVTKDSDFVQLQESKGSPPRIVWLTCGNVSNRELQALVSRAWPRARALIESGEALVEISSSRSAS